MYSIYKDTRDKSDNSTSISLFDTEFYYFHLILRSKSVKSHGITFTINNSLQTMCNLCKLFLRNITFEYRILYPI